MPKQSSQTTWGKASLVGTSVSKSDFDEIKNAINKHRSFLSSQHNQYHGGNVNGNYGFGVAQTQGTNITYNSINDIKKAVNAFYYGNGAANNPYKDVTSTKQGQIISASDVTDLRAKVNHVEVNCVACDTCQFSTWSDYSDYYNWSDYNDWSNWSDYSDWSNWSDYSDWSQAWSDYSDWSGNYTQCANCPVCPDQSWSGQTWKSNSYLT